jgi:hypothetical protein
MRGWSEVQGVLGGRLSSWCLVKWCLNNLLLKKLFEATEAINKREQGTSGRGKWVRQVDVNLPFYS